jgi:serine/threonine protein kinase
MPKAQNAPVGDDKGGFMLPEKRVVRSMNVAHRPFAQPPASTPERFLLSGSLIAGRYRVIRSLGRGGMASVFLAEDTVLGKSEVAIKILRNSAHQDSELVDRFLREVRLTHKINHEHVVRTFDFGREGKMLFYTMEYLPGMSLDDFVRPGGISVDEVLRIASQLLKGISAVHAMGVVHRDLKPANVIVSGNGVLKITDFGVARLTSAATTHVASDVLGTVTYVAPEVLRGEVATKAVDLYALGVILYELLAGAPPFDDESPARMILRKLEEAPTPLQELRPDVPDWLAHGIEGLLQCEPDVRADAVRSLARGIDSVAVLGSGVSLYEELFPDAPVETTEATRILRHSRFKGAFRYSLSFVQALLIVLGALCAIPVSSSNLFSRIEADHLDTLFAWRGVRAPHPDVVVVSMDEHSYAALKVPLTSAWPRALHAKLLTTLADAGAKRVVFDVIFAGASETSEADLAFAHALERIPTVLGAALGFSQRPTMNGAFLLEEMLQPEDLFERRSIGIGVVGLPQRLGRIRSFFRSTSQVFPNVNSLAEVGVIPDRRSDRRGDRRPDEDALINFYGSSKTIPTVPYETVLRDSDAQFLRTVFKDKIVFVGLGLRSSTGPSQRDAFVTPFGADIFGTEIHATIASNLLQEDWIQQPKAWVRALATVSVAAVVAFVVVAISGGGALLVFAGMSGVLLGAQLGLFVAGWFVPLLSGFLWGVFAGLLVKIVLSPGVGRRVRRRALAAALVIWSQVLPEVFAAPQTWAEPSIALLGVGSGGRFGAEVECSAPMLGASLLGAGTRSLIAVGAPLDAGGAGQVYLYDPEDAMTPVEVLAPHSSDGVVGFGTQVQFIDDINGDGRDDIVVATSAAVAGNPSRVYGFLSGRAAGTTQYNSCGSVAFSEVTRIQLQSIRANSGPDGANLVVGLAGLAQTLGYRVIAGAGSTTCLFEPSMNFATAAAAGSGYGSALAQVGVGSGGGIGLGVAAGDSGVYGEVSLLHSQNVVLVPTTATAPIASFSGRVVAGNHLSELFAVGSSRAAGGRGLISVYRSSLASVTAICTSEIAEEESSQAFGSVVGVVGGAFSGLTGSGATTILARRAQDATGGALVMFGASESGCSQLYQFNNCESDPLQEQASALAGGDQCQINVLGTQRRMVLSGSPGWSSGRGRVDILVEQDGPLSSSDCWGSGEPTLLPTLSPAASPVLGSPYPKSVPISLPPVGTATHSAAPTSGNIVPPFATYYPTGIVTPVADETLTRIPTPAASLEGEVVAIEELTPIPVFPGATGLPAPEVRSVGSTVTVVMPVVKPQLQPEDQKRALRLLVKRRGLSPRKAQALLENPDNLTVTYIFTFERTSEARRFSLISSAHAAEHKQSKKQRVTKVRSRHNSITLQRMPPGFYQGSYIVEVSLKRPRSMLGRSAPSSTTRFRVDG